MPPPPDPLPQDPAELARMVRRLAAEKAELHEQVKTLKALIFGAKSEKAAVIDPQQGLLDLGDLALEAAPPANDNANRAAPERPRRPANRNVGALPRHLPRVERVIEPESATCPCCAGRLHRIGEDVAEALDVVPAIVRVLRTIRPKYVCRACAGPPRSRLRPGRGSWTAAWPPPPWSPMWWWRSSPGICRCTGKRRCSPVRAWRSTAPP